MAFTYDLNTLVGKVRLMIPDTVSGTAVFSDEELTALLSLSNQNVFEATAKAYESIARDRTRRLQSYSEDDTKITYYSGKELLDMAQAARNAGLSGSLQLGEITGENLLDTYRPLWRNYLDRTLE